MQQPSAKMRELRTAVAVALGLALACFGGAADMKRIETGIVKGIETGIVTTGTGMNITGTGTVIMTGLDGTNGFASRMKTAICIAGTANHSGSLYANEMKNPRGMNRRANSDQRS